MNERSVNILSAYGLKLLRQFVAFEQVMLKYCITQQDIHKFIDGYLTRPPSKAVLSKERRKAMLKATKYGYIRKGK